MAGEDGDSDYCRLRTIVGILDTIRITPIGAVFEWRVGHGSGQFFKFGDRILGGAFPSGGAGPD